MAMMTAIAAICSTGPGQGCARPRPNPSPRLEALDPTERVSAVIDAGRRGDPAAVPALVARLEDEDPAVRFYAILALERLTGTRLDYRYSGSAAERRVAVERWRHFVLDVESRKAAGVEFDGRR